MIILGVILLVLGLLLGIPVLWYIGLALIIIGALLWILSASGRPIGGRPYRYY
ncbi:hypothetical protein SEA_REDWATTLEHOG_41 [Gordonia phage RedWattleHog]|uniref:Uncharacterized protein n=1 Tax=Gordonia phage Stormageddon TaxID=2656541 RepID=A0A649VRM4_9CAUD|nr:hypothetical protein KHQ86_gp038 [Gordonia phage Stormageddon]QGJ94901.1 hypothetical protein SEA_STORMAGEDDON_38 [Gordonia phage Stormageddon]QLF83545.1 hypothetical protein SEA_REDWATTLEHOG_41 [Gordonia phage RedWattleHog]